MRQFRHLTPRYIYHRIGLMIYQRRYPNAPWLTQLMVEILDNWLMPDDRGFEWGSGRSTLWFGERVGSLVSVEQNAEWHQRVSTELARKQLKNVEYHLCQDERDYCAVAAKFPPESFDFCLVDGAARDHCALSAISLVKPGGIVLVDNCNCYLPTHSRSPFSRRPEQGPYSEKWASYLGGVKGWLQIWTTNGVFDTGLWLKPAGAKEPKHRVAKLDELSTRRNWCSAVLKSSS
ncbi:MAG: hypothetical protein JWN45_2699 [Acidobacteriaceae bacterium]|nr:hypothetical protein [Acidobacteriaceae bacterium]